MTDFMKMVRDSVKNGSNEKVMWNAVNVADEMLCEIKESYPERYDHYMRLLHEALFGCHYTEQLAMEDIEHMHHTDKLGNIATGNYWTPEQVEEEWIGKSFPNETTKWDKFMAANLIWHDLANILEDEQILDTAYAIFFGDEDSNVNGKVWRYVQANRKE